MRLFACQDQWLRSPDAAFALPTYVQRIKQWDTKQRYLRRLWEETTPGMRDVYTVPPLPAATELSPATAGAGMLM